jgi:hypothetical protein
MAAAVAAAPSARRTCNVVRIDEAAVEPPVRLVFEQDATLEQIVDLAQTLLRVKGVRQVGRQAPYASSARASLCKRIDVRGCPHRLTRRRHLLLRPRRF